MPFWCVVPGVEDDAWPGNGMCLFYDALEHTLGDCYVKIYAHNKAQTDQALAECSQFQDCKELHQRPAGCIFLGCFCSHTAQTAVSDKTL